jgi:hypothetical protein
MKQSSTLSRFARTFREDVTEKTGVDVVRHQSTENSGVVSRK